MFVRIIILTVSSEKYGNSVRSSEPRSALLLTESFVTRCATCRLQENSASESLLFIRYVHAACDMALYAGRE